MSISHHKEMEGIGCKKPRNVSCYEKDNSIFHNPIWVEKFECPYCKETVVTEEQYDYCPWCGQRLDWSE